ncbi:TetR/AcrR family transcriptional regulator [Streptomyces sp. NPDC002680]|uniref:TetR/AcrR family transcriptional regulator n=1 Tax=Streptomyces sp. NPDC002680 TaxID=3364659 RepID=UPI0036C5301E
MARTTPLRPGSPASIYRRLGPERTAELYTAVAELLHETGYDSLTMKAIAARMHCSKATLYRHFTDKQQLVTQALRHLSPFDVTDVDTGSLAGDLHGLIEQRGDDRLGDDAALLRGLFSALRTHPELASSVRKSDPCRLDPLIARAVDRGELGARQPASEHLALLLLGAVITRSLLEEAPVDRVFLHRFVAAVILPALGVASPSREET